MKLIDKDAVVAEIKKRRNKNFNFGGSPSSEYCHEDDEILGIINTLEVKEVDFEKEWKEFLKDGDVGFKDIAKHFFGLGMCAANPLTVKDIKKIYHLVNEVSDDLGVRAMYVNIYQEALKRFKAQKGE